jgi:vesicular inhibitory amino acid transporter
MDQSSLQESLLVLGDEPNEAKPSGEETDGKGATALQTGLNMLNELEGAGLLGLPYAVLLGGWASIPLLIVVGMMAGYTGYCLAMCMYDESGKRVRSNYPSAGRAAFGPTGERLVVCIQVANLLSVCIVYLVLVGSTMDVLYSIDWWWLASRKVWTMIAVVAVLPTVHIGGYRKLSALSALGILCLAAIVIVGVSAASMQISEHGLQRMEDFKWSQLPATFSMFVFAFSAHGIFPDLEASMAQPRQFKQVVSSVFAANIVMKAVYCYCGFLAYGEGTKQVLTANLPQAAKVATSALIVANTLLSFALPLVPVFRRLKLLESEFTAGADHDLKPKLLRALWRTLIVLFCGAVAAVVPDFALAMGFMGSLTLAFLTFIFPTVFFMRLHWARITVLGAACCCTIALVGCLGCAAGIASNIALALNVTMT